MCVCVRVRAFIAFCYEPFRFRHALRLTDGQKVWKLKIYYQSFICYMLYSSLSHHTVQIKSIMYTLYACATASTLHRTQTTFDRWAFFENAGLFANDHHFSMCVFIERYSFDFHNKYNIEFHKNRIRFIYFMRYFSQFCAKHIKRTINTLYVYILWGRKFQIKNLSRILKKNTRWKV